MTQFLMTSAVCVKLLNFVMCPRNYCVGTVISTFIVSSIKSVAIDVVHFTFWISLSMRPKTETKRLKFGLSPELRLTNRRCANSLVTR